MSQPKLMLNCMLAVLVILGCATVAICQEPAIHPKLAQASGLAKVRVSHVEKKRSVDLLPGNLCDPLNTGETVVVSLEIVESTGYVQEKIFINLPWGEANRFKEPLIAPDTVAVGNSYWIAFTKSLAHPQGHAQNPAGVAGMWAEVDSDTKESFEETVAEDLLKWQYEFAPQMTDIGFALTDPAGEAEKLFPSINQLNRELDLIKRQQHEDGISFKALLRSLDLVPSGIGYTVPNLPEAQRKRVDLLREQFQKRTENREEQVKQLKTLSRKFESEIIDFGKMDDEAADKLDHLLSSLSHSRLANAWHIQAMRKGKLLWTREIKGRTRPPNELINVASHLPTQLHWLQFIANPQDTQTWQFQNEIVETGFKLNQPTPKALCSVCSWERQSFTQYYLNAETGGRCIVVQYKIQLPSSFESGPKSALKSIREYSVEDKLIRKREFILPESKDEKKVIQLETCFGSEGQILTVEASTIEPRFSSFFHKIF